VRGFLARHSSLYRWAVRPSEYQAHVWKSLAFDTASELSRAHSDHAAAFSSALDAHRLEQAREAKAHIAALAEHQAANHRLRQTNRELVSSLRQRGLAAAEHPASKCPSCGSLAAVPEDGRHQMGTVRYADRTAKLFCDGTEE
jgi:hypothetical protein